MKFPFPERIQEFMEQHIDSIEQLEILRVLSENPEKMWDGGSLATEVQSQADALAADLRMLASRGLVTAISQEQQTVWRHGPNNKDMQDMVDLLLQTYKERPVTMIRIVYAKKRRALEAFSDAFRIRKET